MTTPLHKAAKRFTSTGLFAGVQSFAELETRIVALPTQQDRGDAFEVFAEAYFATQPIMQARQVWPLEAVPLQVKQRLSVGVRDMGIDGIIETTAGNYDAYQVKFRSARSALTWEELSTFMGLSDKASQKIVFTNSNDLPAVINERVGFFCIRGADLARLEPSDFAAVQGWLEAGEIKVLRKSPLPHQQEALVAITSALKQQNRATAVMACGTGKTLVSLWVAEELNVSRVIVLVPSLALIRQTLHEWLRETRLPSFSYLCVCSDPTVAKGTDDLVLRQSDLDFPVTTEPDAVQRFLAQEGPAVRMVFSTYQSAEVVARGAQGSLPFDLGIFDEAHKTAGREGTRFSFALSDKNLPIQKRLFLTATPRHYDIRHKDKEGDAKLVYSMDVPEVFGPVAYTLTFAEAARRGIICPYKVLVSVVTSEMVTQDLLSHGEVLVDGEPLKAQHVANQIALQQAVQKYGASRIFTFHRSVASAQSFTSPGAEGIGTHLPGFETFHVNGTMRTAERDSMLQAFRHAPRALISNARCLMEGVDVPAVDMVAFMSPRKSKVDIVQATGRAMRKAPDKTMGYVLVPVYVEMHKGETLAQAIARSDFEDVWDVLQAMMEQDAVLVDIVRELREERGRTGGYDNSALAERVEMLGPSLSLAELRNAVTALCVESLGVTWDEWYGQVIAYKERFRDCNVPRNWPENPVLGRWCSTQRQAYRQGTLSAERITRLEALGFVWGLLEAGWEEMCQALSAYKARFGDCDVPASWSENHALGIWCLTQRKAFKAGKLSAERITRLEALGFVWVPYDASWEEMFQSLSAYKAREHHCNVPNRWPENPALGMWCDTQRQAYKARKLSAERITRLEALCFVWDPLEAGWVEMFKELTAYKVREQHCNVPHGRPENSALATWCGNQRNAYKTGKLSPERITWLESLGFVWDQLEAGWEEMFRALTVYKAREHHCNVPQDWHENPALGAWCANQRQAYKTEKLSAEHIARLEALGFVWVPYETGWEEMFQELTTYKAREQHCNVPRGKPENSALASWCHTQRQAFKKKKLSAERITRLEALGFVWDPLEAGWEEMFQVLTAYKARFGDCNVPARWTENSALATWCGTQRYAYRKGTLSAERITRLEALGFEWDQQEACWEEMFQSLSACKAREHHCNVPNRWPENSALATWCSKQRAVYRKGKLSAERITRLKVLGFVWVPYETGWEEMFQVLTAYKARFGDCNVPQLWPENPVLGSWCSIQRQAFKKKKLSAERITRLEALGFVWDPLEAGWVEMFQELTAYKVREQHCNVPHGRPENSALATWCGNQRKAYKTGKLSAERITWLESLGFEWSRAKRSTRTL